MSYIKEDLLKNLPIEVSKEGINKILYQMENCIYEMNKKDGTKRIGFIYKMIYRNKNMPLLVANYDILNEKDIENNIEIRVNEKIKQIKLDKSRGIFKFPKLDIIFIEIKPNRDKLIEKNNCLELDEDINKENQIIEKNFGKKLIYIFHCSKGNICVSFGLINDLINGRIKYYCNDEENFFGCPILSLESFKLIGIHYGDSQNFNIKLNYCIFMKYIKDGLNNNLKEYKNEINIIYIGNENEEKLFGEEFVKNNKNNIKLEINGIKSNLVATYKLKRGRNNVKLIIKNDLENLEKMFYLCISLIDISELEYLDTKIINNFAYMLCGCSSLSDINPLQTWNVSKGQNFAYMFSGCSSLSDINALQNWNVSNGKYFSGMFNKCSSLSDIKALQNWDVSNGNEFSYMFNGCISLSDINPLQNWNVLFGYDFSYMFDECSSLLNIYALKKWNVSKATNFSYMFHGCSKLSDINPLQNWNISNGNNFSYMFDGCSSLSDVEGLQKWNVSKGKCFNGMFNECSSLSYIKPLKDWKFSNEINIKGIFHGCDLSKSNIKELNWKLPDEIDFKDMLNWETSSFDLEQLQSKLYK